jgi:hypothetical protein
MSQQFQREMSISHQDFYRLLPIALKSIDYEIDDNGIITANYDGGTIEITPGHEHKRKIASLELPVLFISFGFTNVPSESISFFFTNFSRVYQRGGG